MKRLSRYNTKQNEAILSYLVSLGGKHTTAGQIAMHFEETGSPVGIATIYRNLDRLVESGSVGKYTLDGVSGACYQYLLSEHEHSLNQVHLKCEECGSVLHLDCEVMQNIPGHVYEQHSFKINPMKTVLYGKCSRCID